MYAIIKDSGRQYKVEEGQELNVDYRDVPKGERMTFEDVLAVSSDEGVKIGRPTLEGANVTAEVLGARLGRKITVQKFRRRKNARRKTGHRPMYMRIRVNKIDAG